MEENSSHNDIADRSGSQTHKNVARILGNIRLDGLAGFVLVLPTLILLALFSLLPIILAVYMSVFRWRPVQGRFLGLQNYTLALGDLSAALLVFAALTVLIAALYLLMQPRSIALGKAALAAILACLGVTAAAAGWVALGIGRFIAAYQAGLPVALDATREMFLDRRGDPDVELARLADLAFGLWGGMAMMGVAVGLVVIGQFRPDTRWRWIGWPAAGLVAIYGATQLISVTWPKLAAAGDRDFLNALIQTVFFSFGTVILQISLGLIIAFALYRKLRGFAFFRFIIFLPYVTPIVAMATVFALIFGAREGALANQFLISLGLQPGRWIADTTPITAYLFGTNWSGLMAGPSVGMLTAIIFGVWSYAGYNAVILMAGLTAIPEDLYDVAELEGASSWQSFRHVTLPLLSPVIFFLVITGLIGTFQSFTTVYTLLGPTLNKTVNVASIEIWNEIQLGKFGYASALAIVLFLLIMLLTVSQFVLLGRRQHYGD